MGMFDGLMDAVTSIAKPLFGGFNLGSFAGGAIGAAGSYMGGEAANVANAEMAQKQMDFQERMSSTSYQRAVTDLKSAGLNPMLAYNQGGASSPGGSTAQMQNTIAPAVNTGLVAAKLDQELKNMQAEEYKTTSDAHKAQADRLLSLSLIPKAEQDVKTGSSSARHYDRLSNRIEEEIKASLPSAEAHRARESGRLFSAEAAGHELDFPRRLAERGAASSFYGQNIRPYVPDVVRGIFSGSALQRMFPFSRGYPNTFGR